MSAALVESATYGARKAWVASYFDRTAAVQWAALTAETASLGRVRRSVRAGRELMRSTLLAWLPHDLTGCRVLDAGCGTGGVAVALARRGARVVAVDVAPSLLAVAAERTPADLAPRVEYVAGDMLDASFGTFDHVLAMDSLLHYPAADVVAALGALALRTRESIVTTFAPRTPMLAAMHAVGRLIPGRTGNRAPAIEPVDERALRRGIAGAEPLGRWAVGRSRRVGTGFYTSQAIELLSPADPASPPFRED